MNAVVLLAVFPAQEEGSELGQRVKSNRFRWHNCHWLEIVTGESLYEEEEEEEEEDEDYLDLLRSAAEWDNPDYFYGSPDGPPVTVPVGEVGDVGRERQLLQHHGARTHVGHSPAAYDSTGSFAPQNSPFYTAYEAEFGADGGAMSGAGPYPPRPMSRADNPLSSPGMLFDREFDLEIEPTVHTSVSAGQLMSSLEDPLAIYNASFKMSLDLDQSVEIEDSLHHKGLSPPHYSASYSAGFAVGQDGIGQTAHRASSRVGF